MEIQCRFAECTSVYGDKIYSCIVENCRILEKTKLIFFGKHEDGRCNKNVEGVQFDDCKITKVPAGITKTFQNIKSLSIKNSGLEKLCKDDLIEYNNIEKITCHNNNLKLLPGDLFENFKSLRTVDFFNNKLTLIEPNIFDELDNLEYVDIEEKPNYNLWFSSCPINESLTTLDDVKNKLWEKFLSPDLQIVRKFLKKVKNPIETLKKFYAIDNLQEEIEGIYASKQEGGLIRDFKKYIRDENSKDFHIQIEDKQFKAHKFILSARSPILAETFKNNPEVECLNLIDISKEIFELILNFIYTDKLPDEGNNYLHIFSAAGRLQINDLKNHAASKLLNQINDENVYEIFKLSNKYNHDELRQGAFTELIAKYPKIEFNLGWITEPEKVNLVIEKFKLKEEAIKKLEDEFKDELSYLA